MAQHERLPKRRSLHTDTPAKTKPKAPIIDADEDEDRITEVEKSDKPDSVSTDKVTVNEAVIQPRRSRPPRTYSRNRARDETSAVLAARSATVSLETRNCGEGRVSLGSAAVPLLALEDNDDGGDKNTGSTTTSRSRKGAVRKRRDKRDSGDKQTEEEREKLDEFIAQQKAFWDEVDDSSLVEEESS